VDRSRSGAVASVHIRAGARSYATSVTEHEDWQAIALAHGLRRGPTLWSRHGQEKIAVLPLLPRTACRRSASQGMYRNIESEIEKADPAGGRASGASLRCTGADVCAEPRMKADFGRPYQ
jgi:hypothetical protein